MQIVVYTLVMRRIQLYLDSETDEALSVAAARQGVSRSALVRESVRASLACCEEAVSDPLDALVGSIDVGSDDDIDSVIYELGV